MKKLILETRAKKIKLRLAAEAAEAFIMVIKRESESEIDNRTDRQKQTGKHVQKGTKFWKKRK